MTAIASPLDGTLMPLSEVPDPVFAQGLVGPGVALEPTGEGDVTVAVSYTHLTLPTIYSV